MKLPSTYEPSSFEKKWYEFWLERNLFRADEGKVLSGKAKGFSIVLPPPNVTGALHVGHALNAVLQDVVCRWKRMKGYQVCWIPGTDHAGIATQWVVEKELAKEGLTREDIGREEFVRRVWKWKERYGSKIIEQLKNLGASCDWSRERFTMDDGFSKAVRRAFVELYRQGFIYRGKRLINWCPRCCTALSDLEVEHEEVEGKLWYIRYPFADGGGFLVVATTRPETMLGDVAVAVNPADERYKDFVGRKVKLPVVGREIPVIADSYVDPEFGTGVVKVTPAHDFNDFEVGMAHNLPMPKVMDEHGRITVEPFTGLDRFKARQLILSLLKEQGLLEKEQPYTHAVGHCYRCKTVVEPMLSDQWFVKTKVLAERAVEAVKSGQVRFVPRQWENTFFDWMFNIKDWCISRQIWWGHRIPAWYYESCGFVNVAEEEPQSCERCGSSTLRQDEDVLDTWFSSALWPFGTLGWPAETEDLKAFYPTDLLVTGFDIIFFWVSRMMMMGYHFMNEKPFSTVYVHALVRDEHGQKMSKTKGNVIDPVEMIEKYGADTLRFTLSALAVQGRDIRLSERTIEGYRHFANKVWNIARFAMANAERYAEPGEVTRPEDRWILTKLSQAVQAVDSALESYRFNDAAMAVYHFMWYELADWYVEFCKPRILHGDDGETAIFTLMRVLRDSLKLLHPFMPFVTEELYQKLPNKDAVSIAVAPWPGEEIPEYPSEAEEVELVKGVIKGVRNVKAELGIPPSTLLEVCMTGRSTTLEVVKSMLPALRQMAKVSNVLCGVKPEGGYVSFFLPGAEVYVKVKGVIDVEKELQRLEKKLRDVEKDAEKLRKRLSSSKFLEKAPLHVVEETKRRIKELSELKAKLQRTVKKLKELGD